MIKILLLADAFSIHTERWLLGLRLEDEFDVYVVNFNPAGVRGEVRKLAKKVYNLGEGLYLSEKGGNAHYLRRFPALLKVAKIVQPDIINSIYLSSYGFMGAILKSLGYGRCLVHFMIGSDIMVAPDRHCFYKYITRFSLQKGDLFISSSMTITKKIHLLHKVPEEALLTQQYGVLDKVMNHPNVAKEYDFVSNRAWIENSNIIWFLRAFSRFQKGRLALIGDGVLKRAVYDCAQPLNGVCLFGSLEYGENIAVMAKSRFFVSLVSSDGASLSLMEAMALGCIPIVSNIAPNREWVEHGVTGYLVDLYNEVMLLEVLHKVMTLSDVEVESMQNKNRETILKKGSFSKNMHRVCLSLRASIEGERV